MATFGFGPAARGKTAGCPPEAVRWDSAANAIYVVGSVTCTLSSLHAATTGPITEVDPAGKVWLLGAELALLNGATLEIRGGKGGDANELRLVSNNSPAPGSFASIRADWGAIKVRDTRITSWDQAANGPDTEQETFGRAFIKARSYLDGTTPRESRLDVTNSDVGYLGAFGDEMSGLSWKLAGSTPEVHAQVGVFGDVTGSRLHDNFSGAYTDGARNVRFTRNQVDHNVVDGISLNDQSSSITVESNDVHDNGRHGIVCSQICDKLVVRGNRSAINVEQGIMLHRGVIGAVVEKNELVGNGGAGVAVFESDRNLIRSNRLRQNAVGLRFSVGSSDNRVESNDISDNNGYGLYFYSGADAPTVGDGRPRRNQVVANSVSGNMDYAVRITNADDNVFEKNSYSLNGGDFSIEAGNGNVIDPPPPPPPGAVRLPARVSVASTGYWVAAADGGVFAYGAPYLGSTGDVPLNQPITGMTATPTNQGYWLVASDGGVFAFGDAPFLGSAGGAQLNRPIVGMTATPSGDGYRLVASDGGVFAFGDATFRGSMGRKRLNHPVIGMATSPSGRGYWLVASDGGVFAFGSDAPFYGSAGDSPLNQPIVGMAPTPTGGGYWLLASDGGVFAFGDATFFGSMGSRPLNQPIVGMAPTPTGAGYWLLASDGGVFAFGDAPFHGSPSGRDLAQPTVALVPTSPAG